MEADAGGGGGEEELLAEKAACDYPDNEISTVQSPVHAEKIHLSNNQ